MERIPFEDKDLVRSFWVQYESGYRQRRYVYHCRDCGKEVIVTRHASKSHSGFCSKCAHKSIHWRRHLLNEQGEKKCNICLRWLPVNKFLKRPIKGLYSVSCSKCHNLKKFGITSLQYEELWEKQQGKCAICGNPEMAKDKHKEYLRALAVDHCHDSGKIRGLVCTNCNIGIGHFKNSIGLLEKAIFYLKST